MSAVKQKNPETTPGKPSSSEPPSDEVLRSLNIDFITLDFVVLQYSTSRKCYILRSRQTGKTLHKLPASVVECYTRKMLAMTLERQAMAIGSLLEAAVGGQEDDDGEAEDTAE